MAKAGQRKCMSCGEFFIPDHRNGERQRYCASTACRRASKAASQAAWLAQPANNDYFRGPVHVSRVRRGAPRIRATAAAGFARHRRYKSPCQRKCLIPLRNVPIVLMSPRPLRSWRYKIS